MSLFNRTSTLIKTWTNSGSRKIQKFLNFLVMPVSEEFFPKQNIENILENGIKHRHEYSQLLFFINYAKSRKKLQEERVTKADFLKIVHGIDLPVELVESDLSRWIDSQRKIQKLKYHFKIYLLFNTFSLLINLINGTILSAFYPAIAWGLGLIILTFNIYQSNVKDSLNSFEVWNSSPNLTLVPKDENISE